jgi:Kinesin-associated microtubule-binding
LESVVQSRLIIAKAVPEIKVELHRDSPTGQTPRKREIEVPESWDRTKSREELILELYNSDNGVTFQYGGMAGGMVGVVEQQQLEMETPRKTRLPSRRREIAGRVE